MTDTYTNPLSFIFGTKPSSSVPTYEQLQTRRKIAAAMMAQAHPYPKTVGEGLSAIGDALGARGFYSSLQADEEAQAAQQQRMLKGLGVVSDDGQTPATPAAPATTRYAPSDDTADEVSPVTAINRAIAPRAQQAPDDLTTAPVQPPSMLSPTPVDQQPMPQQPQEPGVSDGGYNFLDAQAGMKATPGYLQDAITKATSDPDMQAYLGTLSAREAPGGPGEVSPTGASGPYQFTRGTGRQYGLVGAGGDQRGNVDASTAAALKLTQDNAATFQRINGRPPTMAELALMHQQGGQTGANMAAGTGNAPPGNLAVNNINPSAGPAAAVAKIKGFYGMPDRPMTGGPRDSVASLLTPPAAVPAPVPDQRLAFNGQPTAAPQPAPITPAPQVAPQIRTVPTAPPAGQPVPPVLRAPTSEPVPPSRNDPAIEAQMQRVQAALATVGPSDPVRGVLQFKLQQLQQDEEKLFTQKQEKYQKDYELWTGAPQKQQELSAAANAKRFGGTIALQQFTADMSKQYDATQQLAAGLPMIQQAQTALAGSYTGAGAQAKVDATKALRLMGVPGSYEPTVATEMLQSRMKAIAGSLIKATVGSQNISDADRNFVEQAYSGTINMERESLQRLLRIAQDVTVKSINRHNDRLLGVATDPVEDAGLRNTYRVPMPYGQVQGMPAVDYLKAHPETADSFDAIYGKGHARAVLRGVPYGD